MSVSSYLSSFRSSKWFKPVLITGGVLVLLIVVLLIIPIFIDINRYRGQIVGQLEQRLGRKVNLGVMSLRVFPSVDVGVDQAAIGEDPQFASGDFIRAKSIRLQIGLMALLRGNPQVEGIELVQPDVTLIREKGHQAPGSRWNWGTLKPLQSGDSGGTEMPPFNLVVRDGRFTLVDRTVSPQSQRTYTGVNVQLDNFSPSSVFGFQAGITMPGEKAGRLEVTGTAGPIDRKDVAGTPVSARVKMMGVEIVSLEALAGLQSPRSGRLTLEADLKGRMSEGLSAAGKLTAEQLRLVAGVEPSSNPLETEFKLTLTRQATPGTPEPDYSLKIDQGDLKIGKTQAGITGQVRQLVSQPSIDLQVKGDRMSLDSLLESAYAFGFGPPKGTAASGLATINVRATGSFAAVALNGQADIRDLRFKSAGSPQVIQVSDLKLTCDPSAINASPFRSQLGSRTTVEIGALRVSNYSQQPRAHLEIATNNAELEDLIKIAESFGVSPGVKGTGAATLKAILDLNLAGSDLAMMISGQGKLSQAKLQTAALKKTLEVNNADLTFTGDRARIENLSAQLGQSQAGGWVEVNNFDQPQATFDLKMNQLNVTEIQQSLAWNGPRPAAGRFAPEIGSSLIPVVMAQPKPTASVRPAAAAAPGRLKLTANGQAAIGKVLVDNLTFTDVQSKIAFKDQILDLDPLSLKLYGGGYQGKAQIDQRQSDPEVGLSGRLNGVDLNQFLSAAMGQSSVVYGTTEATVDLRGRGRGSDQFLKSLVGQGNLAISNGKVTSFDLMKQVESLGRLTGLPTGGAGTAFRSLKTNFRFDRGQLTTDALQIVMDDLQVTGIGTMQLGDNVITNYDILAKLSPALSKRFAGGGEGESTASGAAGAGGAAGATGGGLGKLLGKVTSIAGNFFMEQDSIVVPLKMSGPIRQPGFGLNTTLVQKRATERLVGKPAEGATGNKTNKTEEAVKGLLDIFNKKKQKP
ncbi:MAG TPA: AsmA family protein [Blastocatellia bacterium]|nr:AsmA family protein [Blastocatellia bacterium]